VKKLSTLKRGLNPLRRKERAKKRIRGSVERPRLSVSRSLRGAFAQLVDDVHGVTLVAVSSNSKEVKMQVSGVTGKRELSKILGKVLAERAKNKGVTRVVFDRGRGLFHGRIKALADGAREGGLIF
jgi:large subunit ribosomal protein L18